VSARWATRSFICCLVAKTELELVAVLLLLLDIVEEGGLMMES
jgi:hypothetical protein